MQDECQQANNSLPETTSYEAAQKFLQGLVIKNGLGVDWSDADRAQVISLASGCPNQLGSAVSMAGALLPDYLLNANKEPSYTNACSRGDEYYTINPAELTIYPNPASDYIRINFAHTEPGQTIYIYEISSGRLYYNSKLSNDSQSLTIETENWPSGTYIVRLESNRGHNLIRQIYFNKVIFVNHAIPITICRGGIYLHSGYETNFDNLVVFS